MSLFVAGKFLTCESRISVVCGEKEFSVTKTDFVPVREKAASSARSYKTQAASFIHFVILRERDGIVVRKTFL